MTWCQASSRQVLLCPPRLAWPLSLIGSLQHRGPALSKPSRVSGLCRCPLLLGKTSEALWRIVLTIQGAGRPKLSFPSNAQFLLETHLPAHTWYSWWAGRWLPRVWVVQGWGVVKQGVTGRPDCTKFRLMYCYFLCLWTHFTLRAFSRG